MTTHDPLLDDLERMFEHFEGPPHPAPTPRREATRRSASARQLAVAIGVATLLSGASVAGARQFDDMFGGKPASKAVKAQIATDSLGAPPALDPGIAADRTVAMIRLPVARGTVTLYVSPSKNAAYTYCSGVSFSWLGGKAGLGCLGPITGSLPPIDLGISVPGVLGTSAIYVSGRINDARASTVRFALPNGSTKTVPLVHGFFLTDFDPDAPPTRVDALDAHDTVIATQDMSQPVVGIPTK